MTNSPNMSGAALQRADASKCEAAIAERSLWGWRRIRESNPSFHLERVASLPIDESCIGGDEGDRTLAFG